MRKIKKTLKPKYIVHLILKFSAIISVGFGIFGLFVVIFLNRKIGPTYLEGVSALKQIQGYLPSIIFATAIVQALTLCIIAMLLALFWSHSIAGPLLRFRRHLTGIAHGKLLNEPLNFRSADQLHGLAQAFSEMIISQQENSAKALALLVRAQKLLDESGMLEKQGKKDSEEFRLKLKQIKEIYLSIKDIYTLQKPD